MLRVNLIIIFFLIVPFSTLMGQEAIVKGDTIKIVSWNIQMLPKLYQPFTKLARKKQKTRAPKIIQYLNAADFDLVVLQEVFDKSIQRQLVNGLIVNYPYQQSPLKEGITWRISSGVMILSKYPLELKKHVIFNTSEKSDKAAQKACTLVEIEIGNKKILVGGTHFDSKSEESRYMQYEMTKNEIISDFVNDSIPFYLVGDFNTAKSHQDYTKMINAFNLNCFELNDERPYTFDEFNTWNESGYHSWIDFIFYNNSKKHQPYKQYILRPTMSYNGSKMDLADLYQIVLETVIY